MKTDKLLRTKEANTALAFVSLQDDGERDFSFYRNPSADLLFSDNEIEEDWFNEGDILHFCSVDLIESPMKYAHKKAIKQAKDKGCLLVLTQMSGPLWDCPETCRDRFLNFLPESDLVKIADEELAFVTGIEEEREAISSLFIGRVKAVICTKGFQRLCIICKGRFIFSGWIFCTGPGYNWGRGCVYWSYSISITKK